MSELSAVNRNIKTSVLWTTKVLSGRRTSLERPGCCCDFIYTSMIVRDVLLMHLLCVARTAVSISGGIARSTTTTNDRWASRYPVREYCFGTDGIQATGLEATAKESYYYTA